MRLIIDTLVAMMLATLLAGVLVFQDREQQNRQNIEELRTSVRAVEQQIMLQAALEKVPRNEYGYPITIDPEWFLANVPRNPLVGGMHLWLEIAAGDELAFEHPRHRVAADSSLAGFWYNPRRGIVRARVPQMVSDEQTLDVYNFVNQTSLFSLFADPGTSFHGLDALNREIEPAVELALEGTTGG